MKDREAAGLGKFQHPGEIFALLPSRDSTDRSEMFSEPAGTLPAAGALKPSDGPFPAADSSRGPTVTSGAAGASTPGTGGAHTVPSSAPLFGAAEPPAASSAALAAPVAAATPAKPAAKKPVVSGWGADFLKQNASDAASAQKAAHDEIEKQKAPAFGSPVPAPSRAGAVPLLKSICFSPAHLGQCMLLLVSDA